MRFDQSGYDIRCEWGTHGLRETGPTSDVVVIVDVLSYTTAVDIATARGGVIFPYPFKDESATGFAASVDAELASTDRSNGFSLSPHSLGKLPSGFRLVLPSPNGAALCCAAEHPNLLAACLRNATAVARAAQSFGSTVAVIPAGEMWHDGSLRPCFEDWVGAGAVIAGLLQNSSGTCSPEAELAAAAFERFRERLPQVLRESGSGRELMERGCGPDIELAAELNVSHNVPRFVNRAFVSQTQGERMDRQLL